MQINLDGEPGDMNEDADLSRANNVAENSNAGMYGKNYLQESYHVKNTIVTILFQRKLPWEHS